MRRLLLSVTVLGVIASGVGFAQEPPATVTAPSPTPAPSPIASPAATPVAAPTPESGGGEADARRGALELAGAFSNDGYKIRDGFLYTSLESGKPVLLKVNLFAGNEYWFCASALSPARAIEITVYNRDGELVDQQDYRQGPTAAAGVEPFTSGEHIVEVSLEEGEKSHVCLIYCYK